MRGSGSDLCQGCGCRAHPGRGGPRLHVYWYPSWPLLGLPVVAIHASFPFLVYGGALSGDGFVAGSVVDAALAREEPPGNSLVPVVRLGD